MLLHDVDRVRVPAVDEYEVGVLVVQDAAAIEKALAGKKAKKR